MDITYERVLELAFATYVSYADYLEWSNQRYRRADDAEKARMDLVLAESRERALGKCELIAEMFDTHTYDVSCDLQAMYEERFGGDGE